MQYMFAAVSRAIHARGMGTAGPGCGLGEGGRGLGAPPHRALPVRMTAPCRAARNWGQF